MEIVHYYDTKSRLKIYSEGRTFGIEYKDDTYSFKISLSIILTVLSGFRLTRRLFRLDKSNAYPLFDIDNNLESIVFIYQSKVYLWTKQVIKETYTLEGCRNVMHQAIAECGDGFLYFGEYGSNQTRASVPVYRSIDRGLSWQVIYRFKAGSIKHIHAIQWDPVESKLWVSTGDFDNECKIVIANSNFSDLEFLGDGSQTWRTCHIFFEADYVIWGMDSQLEQCYIIKCDRTSRDIVKLSKITGPAWYGRKWIDNQYLITTSVEPGVNCLDNKVKVYVSDDLHNWRVLCQFKKDIFNPVYFKFGSIGFSEGNEGMADFYFHFEAIEKLDGKSVLAKEVLKCK
jgi:hypothetical protein